jgi:hypothetical protein
MGRKILKLSPPRSYRSRGMRGIFAKCVCVALALVAAASANAQQHHYRHRRTPKAVEEAAPAASIDKRDRMVAVPGLFSGRPYWLALAQCGGVYFKLNTLYTDAAVRARVIKPDPHANAEYTKKLNEAISIATTYFDAAENFLRADRGLDRDNAVLTYDGQSRAAGDRVKTIDAALAATKGCPALYQACQAAHPKACSETLASMD